LAVAHKCSPRRPASLRCDGSLGRWLWLGLRQLAASPSFSKHGVFFYLDAHWYSDLPLAEEIDAILRVNKALTRGVNIASPDMENLAAVGPRSDTAKLAPGETSIVDEH
jgi:hypothetical protein